MFKRIVILACIVCMLGAGRYIFAEDDYYYLPIRNITVTKGKLPKTSGVDSSVRKLGWSRVQYLERTMQPYVADDGQGEMYLVFEEEQRWNRLWSPNRSLSQSIASTRIAVKVPEGRTPSGRLFIPEPGWSGMSYVDFSINGVPSKDARTRFYTAKEQYYRGLHTRNIPGSAWFRHRANEAYFALEGKLPGGTGPNALPFQRNAPSDLVDTYSLFTGGRAISENLQIDRELRVFSHSQDTVMVSTIEGISTAEIDWEEIVKGLAPEKDPLAAYVPADQHVIFFPSFQAMVTFIDEAQANGTPVLHLLEPRSEDALTQERYEHQLCLSLDILTRIFGSKLIRSIAFTGSDPYLRTGSDVAVLFEAFNAGNLKAVISARHAAVLSATEKAESISGTIKGIPYSGIVSPTRKICSYMASAGNVVIVTNSLFQLDRIVQAVKRQIPAIASLKEYTFFRDRYKIGEKDESALLILSDATIRRWCGPRMRIGASRRTRAAAALSELQARYLDRMAAGSLDSGSVHLEKSLPELGNLQLTSGGIVSSVYGSLEFLTPISEISLKKVSKEEARAYDIFRQNYQRRWQQFFDPIAVRFSIQPESIGMDVTVRPLIASSEYRRYMDVVGSQNITPDAGDPHAESLLHYIMSIDTSSRVMNQAAGFALMIAPRLGNPLSWIGKWISFYADEDPFWGEVEKAGAESGEAGIEEFMEKQFMRLPFALHIDVNGTFRLIGFLMALRTFIEQTAPGMTVWENLNHNNRLYVKITLSAEGRAQMKQEGMADFAVYYAPTQESLIISLQESVLQRALDRISARKSIKGRKFPAPGDPWLGKSLSVQLKKSAFTLLQVLYRGHLNRILEQGSWGNIPILNEWKQRYGNMLPTELHKRFWHTELVCPGGGVYVWNNEFRTMESTVFGHPGQPRTAPETKNVLFDITGANLGLTFEDNGLHAVGKLIRTLK